MNLPATRLQGISKKSLRFILRSRIPNSTSLPWPVSQDRQNYVLSLEIEKHFLGDKTLFGSFVEFYIRLHPRGKPRGIRRSRIKSKE